MPQLDPLSPLHLQVYIPTDQHRSQVDLMYFEQKCFPYHPLASRKSLVKTKVIKHFIDRVDELLICHISNLN